MRENTDKNNSKCGHFLRSERVLSKRLPLINATSFHIQIKINATLISDAPQNEAFIRNLTIILLEWNNESNY